MKQFYEQIQFEFIKAKMYQINIFLIYFFNQIGFYNSDQMFKNK